MSSHSNQRGEYGARRLASLPPSSVRMGEMRIETRLALASHVIIGVGIAVGILGWPMYAKKKPLGVIALGASGSMVSAGIIGLLLGRAPAPSDS